MKKFIFLAIILLVGFAVFYLIAKPGQKSGVSAPKVYQLSEYSSSGQSGKATLTEENGKVKVSLEVSSFGSDKQPAHIHKGNCPKIGPVVLGLQDVVSGGSETILETTMQELLSSDDHLNVNVHKSYDDFGTYSACGDIK